MNNTNNRASKGRTSNTPHKNNPRSGGSNRSNNKRGPQGRDNKRPGQRIQQSDNSALLSKKPNYLERKKHVVDRDSGAPTKSYYYKPSKPNPKMIKGNLGASVISEVNTNQKLKTNAAPVYPEGKKVRIIPLGGLNEVGMNMTAIECGDDIMLIDTGFGFGGGDRYPGVDYIIPDIGYLEQNRHKIRGLIYTHGHLDHIGGAPYLLPKLGNIPIYGSEMTLALVKNRLEEFNLHKDFHAITQNVEPGKKIKMGIFDVEPFRLNHSIPDTVGLSIDTPMGKVVYCTDWKFDNTPYDNSISDYAKLAEYGNQGVRLLMTDSLGALKPGYSISEKHIEETVLELFVKSKGRVIFTTFSTTIARMQHVINACEKTGRRLALVGRSMINNFNTCFELGKIKLPPNMLVDVRKMNSLPPEKIAVLCTGSQGEENAVLSRIGRGEYDLLKIQGGDSVIFSSGSIPGNEDAVQELKSQLTKRGADIYTKDEFDIHVSGHASQEDLKLMFALTKPDYLEPIHGEHFMSKKVCEIAADMGVKYDHCMISENGRITELRSKEVVLTDEVITENYYLVDGTGIGAISEVVLEERRQMYTQGSLMLVMLVNKQKRLVGGPEIVSRGFVYMKNSQELFDDIKKFTREEFKKVTVDKKSPTFFAELRKIIRKEVSDYIYKKTEKSPMVIPIVVQV